MSERSRSLVIQQLEPLFRRGTAPSGDGALLARFVAEGCDAAFEALVRRHGPMVLGVCRRVLGSPHDADDAFQATFLVLAQKAARLRDPERLGPWLYGVATRVATRARSRAARHRHEPLPAAGVCAGALAGAEGSDVMPVLDAELGRLSARHRDVLVLCVLEGVSAEEAARRLGCPVGTVKSRLARGREALRGRLLSRGIAPAAVLAGLSASETLACPVPVNLARATLAATTTPAAAPGVVALAKGANLNMRLITVMRGALLVGSAAVAGIWVAAWIPPSQAQTPAPPVVPAQADQPQTNAQIRNNRIKQVLLAFHNYHDANGRFPAGAIRGTDGQPKLSWRVELLPYLDENALYQQFHRDEAWDSPHNKALLARMPAVFDMPGTPAPAGQTRLRAFAGPGTLLDGPRGRRLPDITDGSSNTVLLAVARDPAPWTQPGDLPFLAGQAFPALDETDPAGFVLGLADGSVRTLARDSVGLLPSLVTRAGGELINWPPIQPATDAPHPGSTPRPAPPTTPTPPRPAELSLEQRVQRIEEKLDRILQKLDALGPSPE